MNPAPNGETVRLYGEPMAETLYLDLDTAWEMATGDVLEEHTVKPTTEHLPSADALLQWVCEWAGENGELDEYGYDAIDNAVGNEDVEAAVRALYDAIGSHVTYFMADEVVDTHQRGHNGGSDA